jgi:hypothetical protein
MKKNNFRYLLTRYINNEIYTIMTYINYTNIRNEYLTNENPNYAF